MLLLALLQFEMGCGGSKEASRGAPANPAEAKAQLKDMGSIKQKPAQASANQSVNDQAAKRRALEEAMKKKLEEDAARKKQ